MLPAQFNVPEDFFSKDSDNDDNLDSIEEAKTKSKTKSKKNIFNSINEERIEMNKKISRFFIGNCDIPIHMLTPPNKEAVNRDHYEFHTNELAEKMETTILNYPMKPSCIVLYNVILIYIIFKPSNK